MPRDPKRPLLLGGLALLAAAALVLAGSYFAPWLREFVAWFALSGTVVILLFFVVRRAATAPEVDRRDQALFAQSTMLDDSVERDARRD